MKLAFRNGLLPLSLGKCSRWLVIEGFICFQPLLVVCKGRSHLRDYWAQSNRGIGCEACFWTPFLVIHGIFPLPYGKGAFPLPLVVEMSYVSKSVVTGFLFYPHRIVHLFFSFFETRGQGLRGRKCVTCQCQSCFFFVFESRLRSDRGYLLPCLG